MWAKTLDPNSPDFGFHDDTMVGPGDLDCNPLDPALLLDPTDGKLWMTYGSYIGYIRMVRLDPIPASGSTRMTSPSTSPSTAKPRL